ncbi:hypothetical protein GQ44DRAFT_698358 [Phaeosphaeriaceae sp. PMI808]|nr:hypothetical protein GQ44DRAFT_698358 [Phaeosphaeriaceae sp. PMI808]
MINIPMKFSGTLRRERAAAHIYVIPPRIYLSSPSKQALFLRSYKMTSHVAVSRSTRGPASHLGLMQQLNAIPTILCHMRVEQAYWDMISMWSSPWLRTLDGPCHGACHACFDLRTSSRFNNKATAVPRQYTNYIRIPYSVLSSMTLFTNVTILTLSTKPTVDATIAQSSE